MTNFPTGTVTFLFTDIEGSTKIAQAYPDQWERLRNRHHEILRGAIESNNGYVFQIVGDEFCAAFHTAPDALKAALSAQQGLQNETWNPAPIKVRMGINTGAAQIGDVNDVSGGYTGYAALARVNRVMSAGHGGQILLSDSSASLARGELPELVKLRDMGEQRLKGLLNPEHLWQLETPGLAHEFPPLKTLNSIPNNLPAQLTSFVGREKEIAEVKEELNSHRLVTLVGPGGTGKSRLSLQIAADVLDAYPHGVWFVELAALSDPELVPQTILSAMLVSEQKGKTALETLEEHLRDKNLLIIFDNCEHLVEACAKAAQAILKAASKVKILASSRESLGVSGEVAWHVPSLSLPNPKNLPELDQLPQYESVRLFIDRVALVSPRFAITKENAPAIAQICYRLDGIPLALELAAARAKSMSVEQIMSRLDDRFRLLTGGSRTALPRQQTLRALIDWSYDLLTDEEKLLLRRLAVFSGGWTLELAEQICADEKIDAFDILDMLTHLVDKSLVAVEEDRGAMRYRILETVRQYAREKLFESGDGVEMRNYHCEAFVKLVEQAQPELKKDDSPKWFGILDAEQENIRSALRWSLDNDNIESAISICNALEYYWGVRGLTQEGYNFYKETFDLAEKDKDLRRTAGYALLWVNKIDYSISIILNLQTDLVTFTEFQSATQLLEELGFPEGSFVGFCRLSSLYIVRNDLASSEGILLKALTGARAAGYQEDTAWLVSNLADIYLEQGEIKKSDEMDAQARDIFAKNGLTAFALHHSNALAGKSYLRGNIQSARQELEANLRIFQKMDNNDEAQHALVVLAELTGLQGDYEAAEKYYKESESCSQKSTDQIWNVILVQIYRGHFAFISGDLENACNYFASALNGIEENQGDDFSGSTMIRLGLVLLYLGRADEARPYFEQGFSRMAKVGQENSTARYWYGLGDLERIAGNASEAIKNYQKSLFLRNKFQHYVFIPDILDGLAKVFLPQNNLVSSARWFGCADGLRKKFGIVIYPVDRPDYDKHLDLLKSQMSAAEFESAWAEGAKMELKDAIDLALQGYEPKE